MPHCRFKVKNDYERRITYTWPKLNLAQFIIKFAYKIYTV